MNSSRFWWRVWISALAASLLVSCTGIQQIASNLPPAGSPALVSLTVNGQTYRPNSSLGYAVLASTAVDTNNQPNRPSAAVVFTVPTQTSFGIYVDGSPVHTVSDLTNDAAQANRDYQTMTLYRNAASAASVAPNLDQHTVVITMPDRFQEDRITIGLTDKSLNGTYHGTQLESAPLNIVLVRQGSGSTSTPGSTPTSGTTPSTTNSATPRTAGAFAVVTTSPAALQKSPDGHIAGTIYQQPGNTAPTYPVDASIPSSFGYEVKFTQGSTQLPIPGLSAVDFNMGPSLAGMCGPGFTANSAYGVVFGGNRPDTNQPNTFTAVPLTGTAHAPINFPVATSLNVAGQPSSSVQPEYLASPDGTLAAIVGASSTTGEPVQVVVYDLTKNGTLLANSTVDCDSAATLLLKVEADGVTVTIHCQQSGHAKTLTATVQ